MTETCKVHVYPKIDITFNNCKLKVPKYVMTSQSESPCLVVVCFILYQRPLVLLICILVELSPVNALCASGEPAGTLHVSGPLHEISVLIASASIECSGVCAYAQTCQSIRGSHTQFGRR